MKIIGHRGVAGEEFENSFSSFNRAYDLNLDIYEVDIQITKDGIPVVFHDEDLSRCTNSKGQISKLEFKYIRSDVLLNNGERIPTLEELCKLNRDKKTQIILELKKENSYEIVHEIIKKYDAKQFIISSFFHKTIFEIKRLNPNLKTSAIFECYPFELKKFILPIKCDSVSFGIESCNINMINELKEIQKECIAWTVNSEYEFQYSKELELDGIITNFPRAFL